MSLSHRYPLLLLLLGILAATVASGASANSDCAQLSAVLAEGAPPGTSLIDVGAKLGMAVGQANFALLNSQTDAQLFRLDAATGQLTTRTAIYRDTLNKLNGGGQMGTCEADGCVVPVMIQVVPRGEGRMPQLCTVRLRLEDRNNHKPEFKYTSPTVQVSEFAEAGKLIPLPLTVMDQDSPRFGVKRLELNPVDPEDAETFDVSPKVIEYHEKEHRVNLVLLRQLDREKKQQHLLVLNALDGDEPPNSASLTLTVRVRDENDHRPKWVTREFQFNISESTQDGAVIGQLRAKDDDEGHNGQIRYLFSDPRPSHEVLRTFELNPDTGELRVMRGALLDYERTRVYRIPVVARDLGSAPKQIEETVVIHLEDANDEAPVISMPTGGQGGADGPFVRENLPPGQPVSYIIVKDKDSGRNSEVECSLVGSAQQLGSSGSSKFSLKLQQREERMVVYQMLTAENFDREKTPRVFETIRCHDAGTPPLTASEQILVRILDENDSPPEFDRKVYEIVFDEELEPNTEIYRFRAVDNDEDPKLVFSLDDEGKKLATLGPASGILRSAVRFDREARSKYQFQVQVTDGKHTTLAEVHLTIRDVNDHAPEWQHPYVLHVAENSPPNRLVGRVNATDRDAGDNGRVRYSIGPNPYFVIKPTGEIYTKSSSLDRERTPHFELNVTAYDSGQPARHRSTTVHITLTDENDNSPVFYFPTHVNNRINVSCQESPNAVVAKILANDSDEGRNGWVTFNLTGSGWGNFRIDPQNGDLILVKPLACDAYEHSGVRVTLTIKASDGGEPPRSKVTSLFVGTTASAPVRYTPRDTNTAPPSADPSLAAIVGLIIATAILIVILVFAICLLRRRTFQPAEVARGKRRPGDSTVARSASMPPPASAVLEHGLLKKSLTQDRNMFNPSPPPYYYTCEPRERQHHQLHALRELAGSGAVCGGVGGGGVGGGSGGGHHGYQTIRVLNPSAIDERADYSRLPAAVSIAGEDGAPMMELRTQAQINSEPGSVGSISGAAGGGGGGVSAGNAIRHAASGSGSGSKKRSATLDHRQLKAPYTTVSFV